MFIKNKKAKGHVEAILSFVIFVGFLLFILTIFNPLRSTGKADLIDGILINMGEQLKTEVSSISIDLGLSPVGCFSIESIEGLNCNQRKIIVKDKNGNQVSAELGVSSIEIGDSSLVPGDDKFYTIYCSEVFTEQTGLSGCNPLTENTDYELGLIVKRTPWAESKISDFELNYNNDYPGLKAKIVPQGSDFAFAIWDLNNLDGTPLFQGDKNPSRGTRVDSRTIGIDTIDENANAIKRTVNIRVW